MNKLKELRKGKSLNQKDVANFLGVTQQAYQKYEYGTSEMTGSTILKLADFYDVTTDQLLGRKPLPNAFADLKLSEDDEKEVIDKYMSLPDNIRACMLDVLIKLGDAARSRHKKAEKVPENVPNNETVENEQNRKNDAPHDEYCAGELEDQLKEEQDAKKDVG